MGKNVVRRTFGSLIDKVLILGLFLVVLGLLSPFGAPSQLGMYCGLLNSSPSRYQSIDMIGAVRHVYGNVPPEKLTQSYEEITQQPELVAQYGGKTLSRDLQITGIFIIVNFVYYLLWEWILSASLGKFLCGLIAVSNNNKLMTDKEVFKRSFLFLLLMVIAVGLRFILDISYYSVILLFFLIMDTSVIINGRSLIDIITNTYIIKKKNVEK